MSKVIINDFLMKLGFDGKEVSKGLHQLEGRINAMNKNIQKAQKTTLKGEKDHITLLQKKQDLKFKTARAEQSRLNLSKKEMANKGKELDLEIKLGRLNKISLDIESKRLRILQQKKMLKSTILIKNQQIKRAKIATEESEKRAERSAERHANSSQRIANSSQRTARSSRATSNHLRDSVASANKLQNFLLKGALAYGTFTAGRSMASSLLNTGMASSRAQVGMDAVAGHIAPMIGVGQGDIGQFKEDQKNFVQGMAMNLNRDVVAVQETWRNMLGASINITEQHGAEGFNNIKDIFTGITKASSIFKLDATQTKLMFLGVTQSLQKGKLQAEEVIRQISERSPLAIGQLVKAIRTVRGDMSITEKDMYDLMRNGELLAYDILPEWGRNLDKMAESLAGEDGLSAFMQKSAAGAWDGVVTALQAIKVGIFEEMDAPLARMLTTVKELLNNLEFVWQPMSVWFSNVFDLANEDLKKFLETAKSGTGVFSWVGDMFGFEGGSDNWEETKKNMTPEQLRANSEKMFEKSKKFYNGVRDFFFGSDITSEEGKLGGFFGGLKSFFDQASAFVLGLRDTIVKLMEGLGLEAGEDGGWFSADNLGWLGGVWLASKLTGATTMFTSMAGAFSALTKSLPSLNTLKSVLGMKGVSGLTGLLGGGGGSSTPSTTPSTIPSTTTAAASGGIAGAVASKGRLLLNPYLALGAGTAYIATRSDERAQEDAKILPSLANRAGDLLDKVLPKNVTNALEGTAPITSMFTSMDTQKQNNLLNRLFGSDRSDHMEIGMGWADKIMASDRFAFKGMSHKDVFRMSATNRDSYGNLFDGLSQGQSDKILKGEIMVNFMKDGEISRSELVELSDMVVQTSYINMSPSDDLE